MRGGRTNPKKGQFSLPSLLPSMDGPEQGLSAPCSVGWDLAAAQAMKDREGWLKNQPSTFLCTPLLLLLAAPTFMSVFLSSLRAEQSLAKVRAAPTFMSTFCSECTHEDVAPPHPFKVPLH